MLSNDVCSSLRPVCASGLKLTFELSTKLMFSAEKSAFMLAKATKTFVFTAESHAESLSLTKQLWA